MTMVKRCVVVMIKTMNLLIVMFSLVFMSRREPAIDISNCVCVHLWSMMNVRIIRVHICDVSLMIMYRLAMVWVFVKVNGW